MVGKPSAYREQIATVSVVYNVYRILLPLVLLVTYITGLEMSLLGILNPTLFVQLTAAYAIYGVTVTFFTPSAHEFMQNRTVVSGMQMIDILVITLLIYTSGGVGSGLGLFMIVTIASSSIMIKGRISTFLAAVATLALIYTEFYLALAYEATTAQFPQTGILGLILFATSLFTQYLAKQIYKTTKLAGKQASDIVDLEKLNAEILQRMRTGVIVVNQHSKVISLNSAARAHLEPFDIDVPDELENSDITLPPPMTRQLSLWKINPKRQPPQPIAVPNSNKQIQLNFAFLNRNDDSNILISLEDNRQILQRIQQTKLASLGRLTASIAHEVRNPLGAISHASQLLKESAAIPSADKRMTEIILEHCNRINLIIEDVLDASRHDDTSASRIVLNDWLPKFIENYRATHDVCEAIDLQEIGHNVQVNVIVGQLEQVLNNLFDNGLRYSKKFTGKASLRVEVGVDNNSGDPQPYVHIIDDGAGIDEAAESRLFEPFYTTEAAGTGLGLYISRELCEANQSQLVYNRNLNGHLNGKSCFSVYFSHPDRSVAA